MNYKWNKRFLELAKHISTWSKDPSTQVGAVIVNPESKNILSFGYNGFPKGIHDDDRYNNREIKYQLIVHAEMNAIYNATLNGVSLMGSTLFVSGLPVCSDCAKGIVQVGIKKVIMPNQIIPDHWNESWIKTQSLFNEIGIDHEFIEI
jgi:dCMP deaminase